MGLRQDKLLRADESKLISDRGTRLHNDWRASRTAMLALGTTPRMNVATATELARAAPADGPASAETIAIEETLRDRGRPHGKRFGSLVHLTMLRAPFDADAREIGKLAASAARMIGASEDEIAAAAICGSSCAQVSADASRQSRGHGDARMSADDPPRRRHRSRGNRGSHVRGETDDGVVWTVVDFKTDIEVARASTSIAPRFASTCARCERARAAPRAARFCGFEGRADHFIECETRDGFHTSSAGVTPAPSEKTNRKMARTPFRSQVLFLCRPERSESYLPVRLRERPAASRQVGEGSGLHHKSGAGHFLVSFRAKRRIPVFFLSLVRVTDLC